jgi:hypothetical protein
MLIRLAVAVALSTVYWPLANAQEQSSIKRGEAMMRHMCAACHAIGTTDESAHPSAPPFRQLNRIVDFSGFIERLQDGLIPTCRRSASRGGTRVQSPLT